MMTNDGASEVLNVRELDAVSGGFIHLPLAAYKVLANKGGGGTGGGKTIQPTCFNRLCSNSTQG